MVQANIDNEPVSVDLSEDESITVPTGEKWLVTAFGGGKTKLDGPVGPESFPAKKQILLTDGDTPINNMSSASGSTTFIRGWKV